MVYVRIELWPQGNRLTSRVLGEATIANIGGDMRIANYLVKLSKFGGFLSRKGEFNDPEGARVGRPLAASVWRQGEVKDFPRERGPWVLLQWALKACAGAKS